MLRFLRYVRPIGLFFQNALVDHIGVYTDTNNIFSFPYLFQNSFEEIQYPQRI